VLPDAGAHGYYHSRLAPAQLVALRDEAWPLLSPGERRDVYFEVATAMRDGHAPLQLALSFVPKLLAGGDRFAIGDAIDLPRGLDRDVPDELRGKYEAAMRALFAPGATKLGALPKPSDDLDIESIRGELFRAAAWTGRDPELTKQAIELAGRWRELPRAIRGDVLAIAADASADVYERLAREVKAEPDRFARGNMLGALASTRDPARLAGALPLVLDPKLDVNDATELLDHPSTQATRALIEKFFRDHADELLARIPKDEVTSGAASYAYVITRACDGARRDEIADYVTHRFGSLPGGDRTVKQAIESMDRCIATRAILEPEIRAWLGGFKIPRPEVKASRPEPKKPAGKRK
jgi:hypothetical protein